MNPVVRISGELDSSTTQARQAAGRYINVRSFWSSRARFVVAMILVAIGVPAVALATVRQSNHVLADVGAPGDVHVYDYAAGTVSTFDASASWDSGTYNNSAKHVDSAGVRPLAAGGVNAWWNSAWSARRCYTITNSNSWAATNVPVTLTFDSTTASILPAGADVRATTGGASPVAIIFNAVGPWPSATSAVVVRVPSVAASSTATVCLYYGNSAATAASDSTAGVRPALYRINIGGATVAATDGQGSWIGDASLPSGATFTSSGTVTNGTLTPGAFSVTAPNTVPTLTPSAVFSDYKLIASPTAANHMTWNFTVASPRTADVRLFVSNDLNNRRFNANIEGGGLELTNYRTQAECSAESLPTQCGLAPAFTVTSDGTISVVLTRSSFVGGNREPILSAIEITDATALTSSGGTAEAYTSTLSSWTSPVIDTGSAGVFGTIDVVVSPPNLAVNGTVTMSSTAAGSSAANAINDEYLGGSAATEARTNTETDPWWQADLGSVKTLSAVRLYVAAGSSSNVYVLTSASPFASTLAAALADSAVTSFSMPGSLYPRTAPLPAGTSARYVRVWASGSTQLQLREVEVQGSYANSTVTAQVAWSNSASGPWSYVGPDGTSATSYAAGRSALPYAADLAGRYYRVTATLGRMPASTAYARLEKLVTTHSLPAISRSVEDYHVVTAPSTNLDSYQDASLNRNWVARIKTSEPTTVGLPATLVSTNQATWGSAQIAGYLDSPTARCCTGPYFTSGTGTITSTPVTLYDAGGYRNVSVVLERQNAVAAVVQGELRIGFSTNVRLDIPFTRPGSTSRLSVGTTATQSSTAFSGPAWFATDGNFDGAFGNGSVTHTVSSTNPWLEVDLGSLREVTTVDVYNRTDCCQTRLGDFYVMVSANPFPATLAVAVADTSIARVLYSGNAPTSPQKITMTLPSGATGRYVRIWMNKTEFLHLAEVEVFGPN